MVKSSLFPCAACGKQFRAYQSKPKRFCSTECYRVTQRSGAYRKPIETSKRCKPCAECGKLTARDLSRKRNGEQSDKVFCCRACYHAFRAKVVEGRRADCLNCGVSFVYPPGRVGAKFCKDECRREYWRAKPQECINCGCLFSGLKYHPSRNQFSGYNDLKTCTDDCLREFYATDESRKEKISAAFTGANHPNWQGGSHRIGYRGVGWTKLRRKVVERAGFACEHCGMTEEAHREKYSRALNVNHKVPYHQHNSGNPNRLSNLEALCVSCHTRADWKWRKSNPVQLTLATFMS